MPLYYLAVFSTLPDVPILLAEEVQLPEFNFLTRSSARGYMRFAARTISGRTDRGTRQTVSLEKYPYSVHVNVRSDGLAMVAITNPEYPERVVNTLLQATGHDYNHRFASVWEWQKEDLVVKIPTMGENMVKYQKPTDVDKLVQVQEKVVDIKESVTRSLEQVLNRGESIDSLVLKSQDLSDSSKRFLRDAEKVNRCCRWW